MMSVHDLQLHSESYINFFLSVSGSSTGQTHLPGSYITENKQTNNVHEIKNKNEASRAPYIHLTQVRTGKEPPHGERNRPASRLNSSA